MFLLPLLNDCLSSVNPPRFIFCLRSAREMLAMFSLPLINYLSQANPPRFNFCVRSHRKTHVAQVQVSPSSPTIGCKVRGFFFCGADVSVDFAVASALFLSTRGVAVESLPPGMVAVAGNWRELATTPPSTSFIGRPIARLKSATQGGKREL